MLIGTLNPDDYASLPTDPSGYRRFVPLFVNDSTTYEKVESFLKANRNQLWAEALYRAKAKEPTQMTPELEIQASQIASTLAVHDEEYEIAVLMTSKYAGAINTGKTLNDLFVEFHLADQEHLERIDRSLYKVMGGKLNRLGWKKKRKQADGDRGSFWFPPKELPDNLRDVAEAGSNGKNPKDLNWGRPGPNVPQCPNCQYSHEHADKTGELRAGGEYYCVDKDACRRRVENIRLRST